MRNDIRGLFKSQDSKQCSLPPYLSGRKQKSFLNNHSYHSKFNLDTRYSSGSSEVKKLA